MVHAAPSHVPSLGRALSREIFWVMDCNGTSRRAAVLLARNSKSSIVEAPGKKKADHVLEIRSEIRFMDDFLEIRSEIRFMDDGPCDWGCNRHNRHKTGGRLFEQMISCWVHDDFM